MSANQSSLWLRPAKRLRYAVGWKSYLAKCFQPPSINRTASVTPSGSARMAAAFWRMIIFMDLQSALTHLAQGSHSAQRGAQELPGVHPNRYQRNGQPEQGRRPVGAAKERGAVTQEGGKFRLAQQPARRKQSPEQPVAGEAEQVARLVPKPDRSQPENERLAGEQERGPSQGGRAIHRFKISGVLARLFAPKPTVDRSGIHFIFAAKFPGQVSLFGQDEGVMAERHRENEHDHRPGQVEGERNSQ